MSKKMIVLSLYNSNEVDKVSIIVEEIRQITSRPGQGTRILVRHEHPFSGISKDGFNCYIPESVIVVKESIVEVVNMINDVEPIQSFEVEDDENV